jgi:pimeloyl-ACP methyl ester carboxylesterase
MFNRSPIHSPERAPGRKTAPALALCIGSAATIVVGVAAVGSGGAAADPSGGNCPQWTAVMVPGTGETTPTADPTRPVGMLGTIGRGLAAQHHGDIDIRYLPYPAAPTPYNASESTGVRDLSTTLTGLCPTTRLVLLGYSQGAQVAGDVATAIGNGQGPVPASRVAAVGLIADPRRNPATPQLGNTIGGEGIAGPRGQDFGALGDRVRTLCAPGDIYCSISPQLSPALTAMGHAFTVRRRWG